MARRRADGMIPVGLPRPATVGAEGSRWGDGSDPTVVVAFGLRDEFGPLGVESYRLTVHQACDLARRINEAILSVVPEG